MDTAYRIRMLESFIAAKPDDPFPRYSLALECMNSGGDSGGDNLANSERAGTLFSELVEGSPDYVATYLMYGNFLTNRIGDKPKAAEIYGKGIEVAQRAGNGHAVSELQAALAELPESE